MSKVIGDIVSQVAGGVIGSAREFPYVYNFNGTDMYATMGTGWEPLGLPYTIEFKAITDDVLTGAIAVGKDVSQGAGVIFTQGAYTYDGVNTPSTNAATPSLVTNTEYTYVVNATGAGTTMTVITEGAAGETAKTVGQGDITTIGATGIPNQYWGGPIWNLRLTDGSGFQNGYYQDGDDVSNREGNLFQAVTLPSTDDFVIEFDYIRKDRTGTSDVRPFGSQSGAAYRLQIYDSGHATLANQMTIFQNGNSRAFAGAFDNVQQGQHCHIKIEKFQSGGTQTLNVYIDNDLLTPDVRATEQPFIIQTLHVSPSGYGGTMPTGSGIKNLSVSNATTGDTWFWSLDAEKDTPIS